MDTQDPGDNVENVTALVSNASARDWSAVVTQLAENKEKTLFADLFQHFAPKVKAYIIRLGLVESNAEEIMQECMLSVWRKAHLFNASKAKASTWIFTLARNQSIDWMRKQKYPEYSLEEWHEEVDERSNSGEQLVQSERIAADINSLSETQSQVIYMSFFEGRSHSEISERLGVPLGSVKSRIRLASEKLKTKWRDDA